MTVNGNYTFTVYWGDGTEDTITSPGDSAVVHTYSVAGTYEVVIQGTIEGWSFGNNGDPQKLVQVKAWGPLKFGNTSGQFYGCKAMIITATDKPDLSDTSSLANAFRGCYALTAIPSLNEWDTSGVTDMRSMFEYTCFNQAITNLDTSKVTNMSRMFYEARKFNRNFNNFDTSQVVDMSEMFYDANVFNQDISAWDTSNVTDMSDMFSGALAFNHDIFKLENRQSDKYGLYVLLFKL